MSSLKNFIRLIKIQQVLVAHGLVELIDNTGYLKPLRYLFILWPGKFRPCEKQINFEKIKYKTFSQHK